jgi:hypothetical protein
MSHLEDIVKSCFCGPSEDKDPQHLLILLYSLHRAKIKAPNNTKQDAISSNYQLLVAKSNRPMVDH